MRGALGARGAFGATAFFFDGTFRGFSVAGAFTVFGSFGVVVRLAIPCLLLATFGLFELSSFLRFGGRIGAPTQAAVQVGEDVVP